MGVIFHSKHDIFVILINWSPKCFVSLFPSLSVVRSDLWQRYGAAAGQATDNAVNSAINVGITAFNVDNLGVKAVVKRTGKQTAKAILEDYKLQEKPDKQVEKSDH